MSLKDLDTAKLEQEIRGLIKDMDEESSYILKQQSIELWIQDLGEKHHYLANNVPNLFEIVLQTGRDFDFSIMREFFDKYQKLKTGRISQEEANSKIDEYGRNKWINPILNSKEFAEYKKTEEYQSSIKDRLKDPDVQRYKEILEGSTPGEGAKRLTSEGAKKQRPKPKKKRAKRRFRH